MAGRQLVAGERSGSGAGRSCRTDLARDCEPQALVVSSWQVETTPRPPAVRVTREKRLPALDGLRGLAVLSVLIVHANGLLDPTRPVEHAMAALSELGAYGVDLFFVLSGFLITGILLDSRASPNYFSNFYARRFLRLFPVYYGYLLVVAMAIPALHRAVRTSMPDYGGGWGWYLAYLSNWKPGRGASDPYLGHFWSLAVEEQFYLLWPATIFFVPRRMLAHSFLGIVTLAIALRIGMAAHGVWWNTLYRITPARTDALALGALAALAVRNHRWQAYFSARARTVFLLSVGAFSVTAIAAGDASWKSPLNQTVGSVFVETAFAALVLKAAAPGFGLIKRIGTTKWLMAFGKYSYTMYVIHVAVYFHLMWLIAWVTKRFSVRLTLPAEIACGILMIATVFFLASLSWRYIEYPLLSLKKRFPY
jgi:peptidoglycan/LPS O-acetylase OafA/YrhL